jgi:preprotein translocase subunit SecE
VAELIAGMFQASRYKRSQGRIARQVTFAAVAIAFAIGAWRINSASVTPLWSYGVPSVLLLAGLWIAFRIVNLPSFADFLISVEAEMNKVSWPGRTELWRASIVVISVIFLLAAILFIYDFVLKYIFNRFLGL